MRLTLSSSPSISLIPLCLVLGGIDPVSLLWRPDVSATDAKNLDHDAAQAHSVLVAILVALSRYPDVQAKARAQLDTVVGPDRLPTLADRPALPYVDAIIKETMCWHVTAPLALPHLVTEDNEYNAYHIPKGSLVLANTWYRFPLT